MSPIRDNDKQQGKIGLLSFDMWNAKSRKHEMRVNLWCVFWWVSDKWCLSLNFRTLLFQPVLFIQNTSCRLSPADIGLRISCLSKYTSKMRDLSTCGLCYCASVTIDAWASKDIRRASNLNVKLICLWNTRHLTASHKCHQEEADEGSFETSHVWNCQNYQLSTNWRLISLTVEDREDPPLPDCPVYW